MIVIVLLIVLTLITILIRKNYYETYDDLPDAIQICKVNKETECQEDDNKNKQEKENKPIPCSVKFDTDFFGNTYQSVPLDNYQDCCQKCYNDNECLSWSYDKTEKLCRLKNQKETNESQCEHRISGVPTRITSQPAPFPDNKAINKQPQVKQQQVKQLQANQSQSKQPQAKQQQTKQQQVKQSQAEQRQPNQRQANQRQNKQTQANQQQSKQL